VSRLALCASLAVLALAPSASGQPQAPPAGVLLSNGFLGVYRLGPTGGIHKLIGRDVRPLAIAADGTAAGVRASDRDQSGPLFLARGTSRVELPHSTGGVACVAFSADGSFVAYVSGKTLLTKPSPDLSYFRIDGTLWLAAVAHPDQARAVDTGTFAVSECPLAAPTGQRLAYFIRTASGDWELRLYRDGGVATVVDDPSPVPSNHDRSFAWAPNGTLGFIWSDDLWAGGRRIATNLTATLAPRPSYGKAIDFSSNGRLLAVSVGNKTGIFGMSGRLVRVVPGHLIDWSGSQGVLTIGVTKKFQIAFYRFPLRGAGRVLAYYFKLPAVSDPAGAWFAYSIAVCGQAAPCAAGRFVFRRADGSLLRTVPLRFTGGAARGDRPDGAPEPACRLLLARDLREVAERAERVAHVEQQA
jgi:hypothetical protein